jgi:uncharacterized surface protein with fasciclin (FAS1) repeats
MSYNNAKSPRAQKRALRMYKRLTGKDLPISSIVDIAVGNKSFSTLVAAVTAADLVTTLNSN